MQIKGTLFEVGSMNNRANPIPHYIQLGKGAKGRPTRRMVLFSVLVSPVSRRGAPRRAWENITHPGIIDNILDGG